MLRPVSLPKTFIRRINVIDGIALHPRDPSSDPNSSPHIRWLPSSITSVKKFCFIKSESLSSLLFEFGSELLLLDDKAFAKSSLSYIHIPSSMSAIGKSCFGECSLLQRVSFESGSKLRVLSKGAFMSSSLEGIIIPESVEILKSLCFFWCTKLTEVSFKSGSRLIAIQNKAFYRASPRIEIPASVELIGRDCFSFSSNAVSSCILSAENLLFLLRLK
jgi:hypothetical protein